MITKLKILIIEDNQGDLRFVKELLSDSKSLRCKLSSAETLTEGCSILKTRSIDLIILDLILPDSQGLATLEQIKVVNISIPIIILSSLQNEDLALAAIQAGAQDYLVKGNINEQLLTKVILFAHERKLIENKIKEYVAIIEYTEDAIFTKNLEGTITSWNKGAEKIYGYTNKIIGKNEEILVPESLKNETNRIMEVIKSGKAVSNYQTQRIHKNGSTLYISTTASPIMIGQTVIGVSMIDRDITTQQLSEKQLAIQYRLEKTFNEEVEIKEASHSLLKTLCEILELQGGEIWIVDQTDHTLHNACSWFAKDLFLAIENINKNSILHKNEGIAGNIWETTVPYLIQDINTTSEKLLPQKTLLLSVNLKSLIGFPIAFKNEVLGAIILFNYAMPKFKYSLLSMLTSTGEQFGAFINRIRSTKREKELIIENELALMRLKQAEEINKTKSDFLAMMSHEIRTPLSGIVGLMDLLLTTELTTEQKGYLNGIRISEEELLHVINNILDYSKLESTGIKLAIDDFNLPLLVTELSKIIKMQLLNKDISFELSLESNVPQWVKGDAIKINQILKNLLNNAVKFTIKGYIKLQVSLEQKIGEHFIILFTIIDSGIGIAKQLQPLLFKPFTQTDSSISKKYGGTGLELSICKGLVEHMHGTIGLTSTPGCGSKFWFKLPFVKGVPKIQQTAANYELELNRLITTPEKNAQILLVEDNKINQEVAIQILTKLGYTVAVAHNGLEALEKNNNAVFDLILMDCQMPEMDGYTTTREIRKLEQAKGKKAITIIAMTAYALIEDREKCLSAGMNDYIAKPIKTPKLASLLEKWLHLSTTKVPKSQPPLAQQAPDSQEPQQQPSPQQPQELQSPQPTKTIDLKRLEEIFGDDKLAIQKFLYSFIESLITSLPEIHTAVQNKDINTAKIGLHRLKGSAGNSGVMQIYNICIIAEEKVLLEEWAAVENFLSTIEKLLTAMKDDIGKPGFFTT